MTRAISAFVFCVGGFLAGYVVGRHDAPTPSRIDVTTRVVPLTSTSSCSTTNFCTDGVESWPARVGGGGWMCVSNDAPRLRTGER